MTESGNTFESQETAHPNSEETNTTATTDATTLPATDLPAQQESATPAPQAPAPAETATEPAAVHEAPAEAMPAAAPHENTPSAEAAVVEPAAATPPTAESGGADAPVAEAAPHTAAEASAVAEAPTTAETPAGEAGTESVAGAATEGEADEAGAEGAHGRQKGRQLPKIPEEEMREIWKELTTKKNAGEEIELEVVSTNRGGVVAQYRGVEVFVPVSHWSLDRHNSDAIAYVSPGDKLSAHVLEITTFDTDARRVTATRRTLLRKDLMGSLEVGLKLRGRVASILEFGAFVDLGGVDGLVHASEISYDRTKKPSELLNKGDEVEVVIREIDREKKRIYLSIKDLLPSPWDGVEDLYAIGSIQHGKVVGIGKNGAFVELSPGLEGFVRVSELSWTKRVNNPKEILRKGMEIDVKVLDASGRKQRLSLSYRQAQPDPWNTIAETHSVGTSWEGEVREISNKGVVVSVGDVEGFLPRGRMGREARKLTEMKVGDKLGVNVIEVNPATHSLIFGLPMAEGEGSGGGGGERGERSERGDRGGGGGGGERRGGGGGGGREGGGRREGGRNDRERTAPPVQPVNEMKSSENRSSFTLGELLGDAIKKQLNYSEPQHKASEPKRAQDTDHHAAQAQHAAPAAAPAVQAEHAAPAPAAEPAAEVHAGHHGADVAAEPAAAEAPASEIPGSAEGEPASEA